MVWQLSHDRLCYPYDDAQSMNDVRLLHTLPPYDARPGDEDEFEYVNQPGPLDVTWASSTQTLSPDAGHVEYTGSSHLCNACLSALGYLSRCLGQCILRPADEHPQTPKAVVQHQNLMALYAAANAGCHMCETIWSRRFKYDGMATMKDLRTEFCWNTTNKETWDGTDPGDARLICNIVSTTAQGHNTHTWDTLFRFQFWPSPTCDFMFQDCTASPTGTDRLENTRLGRAKAVSWLAECKADLNGEHASCQSRRLGWLPTRLLDLSKLPTTNCVYLADMASSPTGMCANKEYITLSHCWGAWGAHELPVLTYANFEERLRVGMDISSLPQTFKDAVEVAGWYNVDWLWIDSLCIIQDSPDDWRKEAPTMCDVYQNALLNVSADHAADARDGCFHVRPAVSAKAFRLRLKPLESDWWVSVDERNLFDWVQDAPSSSRAWIYQERHLARRVLHFTKNELFWECRAPKPSFRCESYPRGSFLRRSFLGQPKLPLHDTSAGTIADNPHMMLAWDIACRDYSKRQLTYETDKLPAISGIARHFGARCSEDTYVAGTWLSLLPRTLFWHVPIRERPESRPSSNKTGVPSWSWLSCAAQIEPSQLENSHYIADVAMIGVEFEHKSADQFGELATAVLHVFGFLRRMTSVMKQIVTDTNVGDAYQLVSDANDSKRYRELFVDDEVDRDIGHSAEGIQLFGEAPDWFHGFEPVEYYCLLMAIAQSHPDNDRLLWGLLLEPEEAPNTFRRVGVIFFRGSCALRMRYRQKSGTGATDRAWDELWSLVSPHWGEIEGTSSGVQLASHQPLSVDVPECGPSALYEFDVDVASSLGFDKLQPEVVHLV